MTPKISNLRATFCPLCQPDGMFNKCRYSINYEGQLLCCQTPTCTPVKELQRCPIMVMQNEAAKRKRAIIHLIKAATNSKGSAE